MRELGDKIRAREATAAEVAELEGGETADDPTEDEIDDPEAEADTRDVPQVMAADFNPAVDPSKIPAWVKIPADLEFPPTGVTWTAMKFEPQWTDRPQLGERQCILWNLSVGDEKFSRRRARGDGDAMMDEQAKQMIRAIDGHRINWGNANAVQNPDLFWDEIGKKCRMLILNHFMQSHILDKAERMYFFSNCLVVRTVVPSSTGRTKTSRTTQRGLR